MTEELDRDRPLFNDAVAVQVKFPDHEKTLALTVRVLQGSRVAPVGSGGGQREGVLHIEVTDELDPFFLYTLQVRADENPVPDLKFNAAVLGQATTKNSLLLCLLLYSVCSVQQKRVAGH